MAYRKRNPIVIGLFLALFFCLSIVTQASETHHAAFLGVLDAGGQAAAARPNLFSQVFYKDAALTTFAEASTNLTSVYDADTGPAPIFHEGNIVTLHEASKGGIVLDEEDFVVGVDGTTLGDLAVWLEDVLGINTSPDLPGIDLDGDLATVDDVPGVTVQADGRLRIVGNIGLRNNIDMETGAVTASQGSGYYPPGNHFPVRIITVLTDRENLGESIYSLFEVYDAFDAELEIYLTVVLQDKDNAGIRWRYFAESGDDVDADRVLGTGTFKFDNFGHYMEGDNLVIEIDRDHPWSPQKIELDFGRVECFGSISWLYVYGLNGATRINLPEIPLRQLDTCYAVFDGDLNANGDAATARPELFSQVFYEDAGMTTVAEASTSLTSLYDVTTGATPIFYMGNVVTLKEAYKGEVILDQEEFIIGFTGTTFGDLAVWLEDVLGINTSPDLPGIDLDGDMATSDDIPGISVEPDGRLRVVGNIGLKNDITLDTGAITASQGTGVSAPGNTLPIRFPTVLTDTFNLGESTDTFFHAYDSLSIPLDVRLVMAMEMKDNTGITWRYFAESADDSDFDRVLGTGTIKFVPPGWYLEGHDLDIFIDRDGMGACTPQVITLDFTWMDGWAMDSYIGLKAIDGIIRVVPAGASIQEEINLALDRDTVVVAPGIYTGRIDFEGKAIRVISSAGPEVTCIMANYPLSLVTFDNGEGEDSILEGFTLSGGNANYGGGIYCGYGSAPTIQGNIIKNNWAYYGGGIYGVSCDIVLKNNLIVNNFARVGGGGYFSNSQIMVKNCTITENIGDSYAGGINCSHGVVTIQNCILWDNSDTEIFLQDSATGVIGYSDVQGEMTKVMVESDSQISWQEGNIDVDPCFLNSDTSDYHLQSAGWRWDIGEGVWRWDDITSRCIDAGNPGTDPLEEIDTLEIDPDNEFGLSMRINLGAYGGTDQGSLAPPGWSLLSDSNNDGIINLNDYAVLSRHWLMSDNELCPDFDRNELIDVNDLMLLLDEWLQETIWH
ncbi:MAG: right-handed parallel beta-helix repeat-containing protein [Sedimentisphaerales bacterium]|nr:right-handed parallel beta-helix repeat-containing protein [Sedimentisphaerales bacterium]